MAHDAAAYDDGTMSAPRRSTSSASVWLLAGLVGCVPANNPPPQYGPRPMGGTASPGGDSSSTAAPAPAAASSWDAFLAGLGVADREKVQGATDELKTVLANVDDACKTQLVWEIDTVSFEELIASEKQKGSRYTWYSVVAGCRDVLHGIRMACQEGSSYSTAFAQKINRLVCTHDPDALVKITHRDGPTMAITDGTLRAGYTGQQGVGVTANISSGVYSWLLETL